MDRVIELIRGADDTQVAKQQLVTNLQLSPAQAEAILQMQLRRLTALEAEKIESEYQQLQQQIGQLRDILASKERIYEVIEKELLEIKSVYATPRRTQIIDDEVSIEDTDLIANVPVAILLTQQGYLKKMPLDTFQSQNRATKGKVGASLKEDDIVEHFVTGSEHDTILFFSDKGLAYPLNAYQIPSHSRTARGVPIVQMLPIGSGEKITSIIAVGEFEENQYLIMLTEKGYIKKTPLAAFKNVRNKGLIAISLEQDDQLRWVRLAKQEDSILIGTKKGMAIHFHADNEQLRPLARNARGVKSMTLREGDKIVGMDVLPSNITANIAGDSEKVGEEMDTEVELGENSAPWALAVTTSGFGKRVPIAQFRLQKRGGMGVKAISFRKEGDELASLSVVHPHDEFMLITTKGMVIRCDVDTVSLQSRYASGVRLQRLEEDDAIAAVAIIPRQPFP